MLLRRSWRAFGVESRRTSTLARHERILRSQSEESNHAATPPSLSSSEETRLDKPTHTRSRSMSQDSGPQPTWGGPNLSTPYSTTTNLTPAGSHEIQQTVDTRNVSTADQTMWGATPYGPPSSNLDRNFRSVSPGLFQHYGPSPTTFGPSYPPTPTWGTSTTPQPTQAQLMQLWQMAQSFSNKKIFSKAYIFDIPNEKWIQCDLLITVEFYLQSSVSK